MKTKTKSKHRKKLIAEVAALAAVLLILCALAVILPVSDPAPQESPISSSEPKPSALPTLPPPKANPYGPTDFQYNGDYLTCLAGESLLGIDVSVHQQDIDWASVRDAGIEFVMIRVGYRGYLEGTLYLDANAQANYDGAKEAGLKIGAYFFSQAVTPEEAREEAEFAITAIDGWELDMPLVYDWEFINGEARTGSMDARALTDCTKAFCETAQKAGFQPMFYFNKSQGRDLLYLEELTDYGFWLAMYHDRMNYPYCLSMWQYTCQGSVPGISGDVDINLYFPN